MNERTVNRLNAATGLVFVGFGLAAALVGFWFPGWPVEFDGTAEEWAVFYRAEQTSIITSAVLVSVALVFLLWFATVLHHLLKSAEAGKGTMAFSDVGHAASIFGVGAIHVSMICFTVAAFRAPDTDPDMIMTMNDMAFICGVPAAGAGIAFFAANAFAILRTDVLPAWLGWFAAVSAVLQAGPWGGAFTKTGVFNLKDGLFGILLVFGTLGLWVALASLVLIQRPDLQRAVPAGVGEAR